MIITHLAKQLQRQLLLAPILPLHHQYLHLHYSYANHVDHTAKTSHKGKPDSFKLREEKNKPAFVSGRKEQIRSKEKAQTEDLVQILKQYRLYVSEGKDNFQLFFADCCKQISLLYRFEMHLDFVSQKSQFEKLLMKIPGLKFEDMQLVRTKWAI